MKRLVRRWLLGGLVVMGVLLSLGIGLGMSSATPGPQGSQLVDLQRVAPSIHLDIRYATTQNFTRTQLYSQPRCLLRAAVAQQLAKVQTDLEKIGLGLKVYDCYRPLSVQRQMWQIVPDSRYVANPASGSRHNRGAAVDLTLVDRQGRELLMPTDFDDFTERAGRNYAGGSGRSRQNSRTLERAMKMRGFIPLATEWWHFDGADWESFPVIDIPFESVEVAR